MLGKRHVFVSITLALLGGCGGAGGDASPAGSVTVVEGTPTATPTPAPTPTPSPTPTPTPASTNPFASFDFKGGTAYPDRAVVALEDAVFSPKAAYAYVPVTLDRATAVTVIVRVGTVDGTARAGGDFSATSKAVIFRPGDALRQTVRIPILATAAGRQFSLKNYDAQGADTGRALASVTANADVAPTAEITTGFRAARTFQPSGKLTYTLDRQTFAFSDQGGPNAWATSLWHGRAQTDNKETGLYVDAGLYPGIEAPVRFDDTGLVLHSQQLASSISYKGVAYAQGATVLDGRALTSSQVVYGQYEWVAKMPNRSGAWPGFWLHAPNAWPPEIDVFEGFGYNDWWKPDTYMSSAIHGGANGVESYLRAAFIDMEAVYGITGFTTNFHRFAVDVQADYITWFVDGVEVNQVVNPFPGQLWYPIMQVGVKTTGTYAGGSGDMIVNSMKVYAN